MAKTKDELTRLIKRIKIQQNLCDMRMNELNDEIGRRHADLGTKRFDNLSLIGLREELKKTGARRKVIVERLLKAKKELKKV